MRGHILLIVSAREASYVIRHKKRENVTKDILLLEGTFTFDINQAKLPFLKEL